MNTAANGRRPEGTALDKGVIFDRLAAAERRKSIYAALIMWT